MWCGSDAHMVRPQLGPQARVAAPCAQHLTAAHGEASQSNQQQPPAEWPQVTVVGPAGDQRGPMEAAWAAAPQEEQPGQPDAERGGRWDHCPGIWQLLSAREDPLSQEGLFSARARATAEARGRREAEGAGPREVLPEAEAQVTELCAKLAAAEERAAAAERARQAESQAQAAAMEGLQTRLRAAEQRAAEAAELAAVAGGLRAAGTAAQAQMQQELADAHCQTAAAEARAAEAEARAAQAEAKGAAAEGRAAQAEGRAALAEAACAGLQEREHAAHDEAQELTERLRTAQAQAARDAEERQRLEAVVSRLGALLAVTCSADAPQRLRTAAQPAAGARGAATPSAAGWGRGAGEGSDPQPLGGCIVLDRISSSGSGWPVAPGAPQPAAGARGVAAPGAAGSGRGSEEGSGPQPMEGLEGGSGAQAPGAQGPAGEAQGNEEHVAAAGGAVEGSAHEAGSGAGFDAQKCTKHLTATHGEAAQSNQQQAPAKWLLATVVGPGGDQRGPMEAAWAAAPQEERPGQPDAEHGASREKPSGGRQEPQAQDGLNRAEALAAAGARGRREAEGAGPPVLPEAEAQVTELRAQLAAAEERAAVVERTRQAESQAQAAAMEGLQTRLRAAEQRAAEAAELAAVAGGLRAAGTAAQAQMQQELADAHCQTAAAEARAAEAEARAAQAEAKGAAAEGRAAQAEGRAALAEAACAGLQEREHAAHDEAWELTEQLRTAKVQAARDSEERQRLEAEVSRLGALLAATRTAGPPPAVLAGAPCHGLISSTAQGGRGDTQLPGPGRGQALAQRPELSRGSEQAKAMPVPGAHTAATGGTCSDPPPNDAAGRRHRSGTPEDLQPSQPAGSHPAAQEPPPVAPSLTVPQPGPRGAALQEVQGRLGGQLQQAGLHGLLFRAYGLLTAHGSGSGAGSHYPNRALGPGSMPSATGRMPGTAGEAEPTAGAPGGLPRPQQRPTVQSSSAAASGQPWALVGPCSQQQPGTHAPLVHSGSEQRPSPKRGLPDEPLCTKRLRTVPPPTSGSSGAAAPDAAGSRRGSDEGSGPQPIEGLEGGSGAQAQAAEGRHAEGGITQPAGAGLWDARCVQRYNEPQSSRPLQLNLPSAWSDLRARPVLSLVPQPSEGSGVEPSPAAAPGAAGSGQGSEEGGGPQPMEGLEGGSGAQAQAAMGPPAAGGTGGAQAPGGHGSCRVTEDKGTRALSAGSGPLPLGVTRQAGGRLQVSIRVQGNLKSLGSFDNPEEAARAFDRAAVQRHNEGLSHVRRLRLNFPSEWSNTDVRPVVPRVSRPTGQKHERGGSLQGSARVEDSRAGGSGDGGGSGKAEGAGGVLGPSHAGLGLSGLPRGVRRQSSGRYEAHIRRDAKMRSLGTWDTPEEAARVYDRAAVKKFNAGKGGRLQLNFPSEWSDPA
ncbi:hypothetical protein HYH03_002309 [Edaphochlamys debaryana]|uniref:AP2/ERF domain-containing protein n=1 Tax=Edaphochlamys debaryana TaxID=47281 RepID=A0A835YC93_9CHLO|nr:hypothetical protein HYH03_002309 [Edaphochlamys debaryana]|eukprot:KAG2500028.1 hypothetical protein HYH03_002309 [Edaphochlamys debaryana]